MTEKEQSKTGEKTVKQNQKSALKTKEQSSQPPQTVQEGSQQLSQSLGKQDRLTELLQNSAIKKRFDDMLGSKSAGFLSSIISSVNGNKQLKECDPMSVIGAAAVAASLDLPINPSLGLAHIVPYKGTAQFQIGWKGFVQLAIRSGQYKTINLAPVCEGQIKNHNAFTGEMEFDPTVKSSEQVGYLLYFRLTNGYEKYFYMTKDECEEHAKKYSASYKKGFGVWKDNFEAMALKTVAKLGLSKYGILSIDMQKAFVEDQADAADSAKPIYIDNQPTVQIEAPKAKSSRLADIVLDKDDTEVEVEQIEDENELDRALDDDMNGAMERDSLPI